MSTQLQGARALREIPPDEALRLLASVPMGRIVFTEKALPAIRPVNHLVDRGSVIVRTHHSSAIVRVIEGLSESTVVAFEADDIDADTRLGWSVIVVGLATRLAPGQTDDYATRLEPWVGGEHDDFLQILVQHITGARLVPADEDPQRA